MKRHILVAAGVFSAAILLRPLPGIMVKPVGILLPACQADDSAPVDFDRARPLIHKKQAGETLTPEEQELANRVVTRAKDAGKSSRRNTHRR